VRRPNAQLEAMLRDFEMRSSAGSHKAAQLRAAVESNDLTLRTFNAAAASGTIRSFEIDAAGLRANHIGRFDPKRGSVTLPSGAFQNAGPAPTHDLVAIGRVQSMLVSFASGAAENGGRPAGPASQEMVANLQDTLNESPLLASDIKRAATSRDPASPRNFGLERFELLPPNANLGGAYVGNTHTMLLPGDDLIAHPNRSFHPGALTFVVGHEIQHAFNRADTLRATLEFSEGVSRVSRSSSAVHDYTDVLAKYLGQARKDEAMGQIAGWNAVRSRLAAAGGPVTVEAMAKVHDRMRDFVPLPEVGGGALSLHPDIVLNADMSMSATLANIEAMGKHYFDRPPRDHFPVGSRDRVMGLNHDHVSNYPNHYGKHAIEHILAAEEKAPLFQGSKPKFTLDMARLGLYEDVLERQGLDLTRSNGNGQYFDSSRVPSVLRAFNHTVEGENAHRYVPIAPELTPVLPGRLDLPAHPDHEFFRQVRGRVVELDRTLGRAPDYYTDNISSALTVQARADGLDRVDHIELSERGDVLRAMQVPTGRTDYPFTLRTAVATAEASTPMEQSAAKWPEAMRRFEGHEQARAETQQRAVDRQHSIPPGLSQSLATPEQREHPLNDPRNPKNRDHALYKELERCLPESSDERLLQFTAACHRHRINEKNLSGVHVDYDNLKLHLDTVGLTATPAVVDLSVPPPEAQESIQHIRQFDQFMEELVQQSQQRAAEAAQQGPVM